MKVRSRIRFPRNRRARHVRARKTRDLLEGVYIQGMSAVAKLREPHDALEETGDACV
jgi:hypothetical protein